MKNFSASSHVHSKQSRGRHFSSSSNCLTQFRRRRSNKAAPLRNQQTVKRALLYFALRSPASRSQEPECERLSQVNYLRDCIRLHNCERQTKCAVAQLLLVCRKSRLLVSSSLQMPHLQASKEGYENYRFVRVVTC